MKKPLLLFVFFFSLLIPIINFAQAPNLGAASSFAVFTSAGDFTNDGTTNITGNIGTHVGTLTGFPPGIVYGQTHVANATSSQASTDLASAYSDLASRTCGAVISVTLGNNQTLTPGTYCTGAASTLNGTLTLDGQGDPNAVFIFQIGGAFFSTSSSSNISLINAATLCNVYWQVNGAFSLGASSVFRGTVLVNGAVSLLEGSAIYGQVLTKAGAIDLHNNIVLKSAIPIGYTHSWNGSANTNWNNAGNWCPTSVPTIANGAYIHFVDNQPTIVSSTYSVNNIGIDSLAVLTIDSNATLAITNSIISKGNISGLGNLIKNGTNTDTISGIVTIANLTFNNNAGTSISSGSANAVSVSKSLTVTGALTTNANLTLTSTSNGTARVAESYGSISGAVTVQRYIPARRAWRFLTAPLRGNGGGLTLNSAWQTNNSTGVLLFAPSGANGFTAGGVAPNIRQYIAGSGWLNLTGTTNNNIIDNDAGGFTAKNKSYVVFVTGPSNSTNIASGADITTIETTGKIITGQQDFTISGTNNHFNLIGNPYASPIDIETFYTANSSKIGTAFYIWDAQLSTYGSYVLVSRTGENTFTYSPNNATEYRYIQSGQAFFTTSNGGGSSVSFQESNKVNNNITSLFRGGASQNLNVNFSFKNPDNSWQLADGFIAIYDNSYSANITDEFDAEKFINSHETVSLIRNNKKLAMEARPLMATNDTLFINMAQMRQLNYKFEFNPSNLQAAGLQAFLQDAYTNTQTAISLTSSSNYEFFISADVASFAENRFRILFKPAVPLPVNINKIKAYQKQNGVQIEWIVSNETNVEKYEVEKSNNSFNFKKIASILSKGNSINEINYEIFDQQPINGDNYYRVKAIDKNGLYNYSEVVKVIVEKAKESITIFPNPSTGNQIFIILNNFNIGKYELKVSNLLAQEILHTSINYSGNNNQQIINTANWATGVYNLLLIGKDLQIHKKVIKQ